MKNMIKLISQMPADEYEGFCRWLRECCGTCISELIEKAPRYQRDAVIRFYEECGMA